MTRVVRARVVGRAHAGRLRDDGVVELLDHDDVLAALRGEGAANAEARLDELDLLSPIEAPEIWCAGLTYERSRDARLEEAETDARDVYGLVYEAERPELFLKDAAMRRTVGPAASSGRARTPTGRCPSRSSASSSARLASRWR